MDRAGIRDHGPHGKTWSRTSWEWVFADRTGKRGHGPHVGMLMDCTQMPGRQPRGHAAHIAGECMVSDRTGNVVPDGDGVQGNGPHREYLLSDRTAMIVRDSTGTRGHGTHENGICAVGVPRGPTRTKTPRPGRTIWLNGLVGGPRRPDRRTTTT